MAKFDAGLAVEALEYDFTAYDGTEGEIREPSTGQVNRFFKDMKSMMKEVRALTQTAKDLEGVNVEELSDEALAEAMTKVDEAEEGAAVFQERTIECIAMLCGAEREEDPRNEGEYVVLGGSPDIEELRRLPYRVLQAFSTWLVGEIRPKRDQPAGPR